MDDYIAEFAGTMILIVMGNGVCANVNLQNTKGQGSGWLVITAGWGLAVFTAVLCVQDISGAHINPAVTIGVAVADKFDWALVPGYVAAQMLGAFAGAVLVYAFYKPHFACTDDADAILGTFCTAPSIRGLGHSLLCETLATFVLVYAVLVTTDPKVMFVDGPEARVGLGSIGAVRVGMIVFAIGLSLGGTTGYAINPARDLGPRCAHALLPIPGKRCSDWSYAAVPVVGPITGAVLAALVFGFRTQ